MKSRILLALVAVVAGLAFGLSLHPAHAAAAELSAPERAVIGSALNLTKVSLDAIQAQITQNPASVDKQATLATLDGIRTRLLTIRSIVNGGSPVASAPQVPVATQPVGGPVAQAPEQQPASPATPAQPAAPADTQQTASVSSSVNSQRIFWGLLIAAVIVAIVLAAPRRKKTIALPEEGAAVSSAQPQPPASSTEDSHPVQSA